VHENNNFQLQTEFQVCDIFPCYKIGKLIVFYYYCLELRKWKNVTILKCNPCVLCLQSEDFNVIININKIVSANSFTCTLYLY
jgi:hypothetical protein